VVSLLALVACSPTFVKQAMDGHSAALKAEVVKAHAAGQLDRGSARKLARAVAERELMSAELPQGWPVLEALRPCSSELVGRLEERARGKGELPSWAYLQLLELGRESPKQALERYRDALDPHERRLAAASSYLPDQGELRRRYFLDPAPEVRASALKASARAKDAADLDALLEASRVDPDPLARSAAIGALGKLGSERAVLALKDRWAASDTTTRMTIAEAWALPEARAGGGVAQLRWVAESTEGLPAVAAALALARQPEMHDRELGGSVLARVIRRGTVPEKRVAALTSPLSLPGIVVALRELTAKEQLEDLRVVALSRLLTLSTEAAGAAKALEQVALAGGPQALAADLALARAGAASAGPRLRARLIADNPAFVRKQAATGLSALGMLSDAALALVDDEPEVRAAVACTLLRRHR
jgi:HEAT repeat protein